MRVSSAFSASLSSTRWGYDSRSWRALMAWSLMRAAPTQPQAPVGATRPSMPLPMTQWCCPRSLPAHRVSAPPCGTKQSCSATGANALRLSTCAAGDVSAFSATHAAGSAGFAAEARTALTMQTHRSTPARQTAHPLRTGLPRRRQARAQSPRRRLGPVRGSAAAALHSCGPQPGLPAHPMAPCAGVDVQMHRLRWPWSERRRRSPRKPAGLQP